MTSVFWRLVAGCTGLVIFAVWAVAADTPETTARQTPSEKFTLRYKFRPGETLRWKVVHRARVDASVAGTSQTSETVSTSVKVWKVQKVESNGVATFEQAVENVDMWQKLTGRMEVRYNSQTDKKPPVGYENVAKSIGMPLSRTTIDSVGKILDRQHLVDKPKTSQEGLVTVPLPETPVAIGDTWSYPCDIEIPLEGGRIKNIKSRQSFTLEEVKNRVATLRVATQILTPVDDPAIEAQLAQRDSAGTLNFDIDSGRIVGQQMDTDKRVVGFRGQASSLHYRTRFTEELLAQAAQAGQKGHPTASEAKADGKPAKSDAVGATTASTTMAEKPAKPAADASQAKPSKPPKATAPAGATKVAPLPAAESGSGTPPKSASRIKPADAGSRAAL
jgi:cell fate (sporulation/competence/biofilm development) regulator YmcA (YheA/YmcA/DUF963 family)